MNYRLISFAVLLSAIIQLAFGIIIKLTGMIGEPESGRVFIALAVTSVLSAAIGIYLMIRYGR